MFQATDVSTGTQTLSKDRSVCIANVAHSHF